MADFLSQDEIDALLDVVEDGEPEDFGSPEFEKLYNEYNSNEKIQDTDMKIYGKNPEEIVKSIEELDSEYIKLIKAYKEHKKLKQKFKDLSKEQPELFI